MSQLHGTLSSVLATIVLASSASAEFLYVGAPGGLPSIGAALASASDGDVILVGSGTYPGFSVTMPVTILAVGAVTVTQPITIDSVTNRLVAVSRLSAPQVVISACSAPIVLQDLVLGPLDGELSTGAYLDVSSSVDVRVRNSTIGQPSSSAASAVAISDSRVEIVRTHVRGAAGLASGGSAPATDGAPGIVARGVSDVHVSLSSSRGGRGGDAIASTGGDGAPGIRLEGASTLLLTGASTLGEAVIGGDGGLGSGCALHGLAASGIEVAAASSVRWSSVVVQGGTHPCTGSVGGFAGAGTVVTPPLADPILSLFGLPNAGQSVLLAVRGAPGSIARLRIGRRALVRDDPGALEDQLIARWSTLPLGTLPADGAASLLLPVPNALGAYFVVQGEVEAPDGSIELTPSVPMTIRQ